MTTPSGKYNLAYKKHEVRSRQDRNGRLHSSLLGKHNTVVPKDVRSVVVTYEARSC